MGMFKKGFEANREERDRQEQARENMGKKLFRFFLSKDGDEADLVFLTEEPITFKEHNIKGSKNGKEIFSSYTCPGDDCEFCDDGDKATAKGAFLVYDTRPFERTVNNKKETVDGSIKLFVYGTKVVSQLDRISTKYGLVNKNITMVRLGSGTSTSYTFERGDKVSLTEQQIKNLLPEKLRDDYNGTAESLYDIVENQLTMGIKNYDANSTNSEEEDDEEQYEGRKKVMNVDDEDSPKKKLSTAGKKSLFKSKSSTAQNSLKKPQNKAKALLKR